MIRFEPVSIEEISAAYELLIEKGKNKKRVPVAYRRLIGWDDPAQTSLLPVGIDKMTTRQVEKSPETKLRFFREIQRLFNEDDRTTGIPKFKLKRFKVNVVKEKKDGRDRERKTVLLSLRDQVMMRVVLTRLKELVGLPDGWNDMFHIIRQIRADLRSRKEAPLIIRTDISEFHPSVDRSLLLANLKQSIGDRLDERTAGMIDYVVDGYPSASEVTGLPMGMSTSVLLAEFYAGLLDLDRLHDGVHVYRYADDILIIADKGIDPQYLIERLDERFSAFGLRRNLGKTEVVEEMAFTFLGVSFNGPEVGFDPTRHRKWAHGVWGEISKDITAHEIVSKLDPGWRVPERSEIIRSAFREYMRGARSSRWKLTQKILLLNKEDPSDRSFE